MLLQNRVAIITGAARGIGRSIAGLFAEHGARVVLCDLRGQEAKAAAEEIQAATGMEATGYELDVTRKPQIERVCDEVLKSCGKIDLLVNNAGILKLTPIVDMTEEDWELVFRVNVKGVFLFTQAAARAMIARRSGKIINMSSCSGKKPDPGGAAYCASKSAIIGLTRVTALELGVYGITCNAICPGATDTAMVRDTFLTSPDVEREWIDKTALKRLGKPEDVAKVALFLASDLANHVTGEALIVSAGEVMGQ